MLLIIVFNKKGNASATSMLKIENKMRQLMPDYE